MQQKMSFERWMNYIENANKTSIITGNIRKVHYRFEDGTEMIEEYSMDTGIIVRRAWKKKQKIDVHGAFNSSIDPLLDLDIEIGNANVHLPEKVDDSDFLVKESNSTVICNDIYFKLAITFLCFFSFSQYLRNE